ncbi:MAG TPA: nicotinate-nucleotide diphosphorylase (carboxylating), partial [Methylophilaceae bacterium]|nr:nicotinate-nucleotide diphosphorylase (carboxylating) [Methylophilaceae bacterium]
MTIPLFTQQFPKDSAAFQQFVSTSVRHCLQEDMGNGDLTAELIDAAKMAEATIIARESAVICGIDWVNACFKQLDTHAQLVWHVAEGETLLP